MKGTGNGCRAGRARVRWNMTCVIVGAGPAGLSAAIRLKHGGDAGREVSVAVLEKGVRSRRAYSFRRRDRSGRAQRTVPDWKAKGAPLETPVTRRPFIVLGPAGAARAADVPDAAADEQSRQLHRLAVELDQMAGRAGRSAWRRDLSWLGRRPRWCIDEAGALKGVRRWRFRDRHATAIPRRRVPAGHRKCTANTC